MILALDAMGGDLAPHAAVEGALEALKILPEDVSIRLYGRKEDICSILREKTFDANRLSVVDCPEIITCEETPATAVRRKKDSSLVRCARAVSEKEADCFISAGSTGAVLSAGTLIVRRVKGVLRPALGTMIPNLQGGHTFLIDCGANVDSKSSYLAQFAVMGSVYVRMLTGKPEPVVGLLNNGTEEGKGNELTKESYQLLKACNDIRFGGNCEARELMSGDFDVIVTDGFAGNVLLKGTEGAAKAITAMLKTELLSTVRGTIGGAIARPALQGLKKKMDYKEVGGAPLLGVNGGVIKAHGSSDAKAFLNALRQAEKLVRTDVTGLIAQSLINEETAE